MAANSDPAVKRAARMADAWFVNPHATSDTIGRQMAIYRAELDAAGKGAARVAGHQGGLLRQGSSDCSRNGRTPPAGEIPGLCQVGAGQSHARRHRRVRCCLVVVFMAILISSETEPRAVYALRVR